MELVAGVEGSIEGGGCATVLSGCIGVYLCCRCGVFAMLIGEVASVFDDDYVGE